MLIELMWQLHVIRKWPTAIPLTSSLKENCRKGDEKNIKSRGKEAIHRKYITWIWYGHGTHEFTVGVDPHKACPTLSLSIFYYGILMRLSSSPDTTDSECLLRGEYHILQWYRHWQVALAPLKNLPLMLIQAALVRLSESHSQQEEDLLGHREFSSEEGGGWEKTGRWWNERLMFFICMQESIEE